MEPKEESHQHAELKEDAEQRFIEALDDADFHGVDVEHLVCRKLYQRERDKITLNALQGSIWVVWLWVLSWYPLKLIAQYHKLSLSQDWLGFTFILGFVSILGTGFPELIKLFHDAIVAWKSAKEHKNGGSSKNDS